jgi:UDP-3-O-[3-hydroxymyristoyl] N-acetylglucosamine deacetylase
MRPFRYQRTIRRPVSVEGTGYWSGRRVKVEFRPAPVDCGITFVRDDLGASARIPGRCEFLTEVPRRTNLSFQGAQVEMVEHVLATLAGLGIDNCDVGVDQAEMPGCDGSAQAFVQAIDSVGTVEQDREAPRLEVTETVRHSFGDAWIEARPAAAGEYTVQFELEYPHDAVIGRQTARVKVTPELFRREIAPCRTFLLEREAEELKRQGLGVSVSYRDLLVFGTDGPIDNRLRFPNECARHKALDVIGDMALTGCAIVGHIVAYRSGHRLHAALAGELAARFKHLVHSRACA